MSSSAAVNDAIKADSQELGHKVFVGNMTFTTTDADLKEAFAGYGTISDAQVIVRGTRSLGYGFVTFASEHDAVNAISKLDKTELDGRAINVELAKPTASSAAGQAPKAAAEAALKGGATNGEVVSEGAGEVGKRKPRNKARANKNGRRPRADDETEEAGDAPQKDIADGLASTNLNAGEATANGGAAPGVKKRKPRRKGVSAAGAVGETGEGDHHATTTTDGEATGRKAPHVKRTPLPTGPPSKNQLFVANLPFSLLDEGLKELFSEYHVTLARVVKKNHGPSAGRSKGFGFVTLENEEQQKKALAAFNGKEVEGREIQVKVALEQIEPVTGDHVEASATH